jgi:predicted phage tail protein
MNQAAKKPTGTVQIVIGALLIAWGFASAIYGISQMAGEDGAGAGLVLAVLLIAGGVALLISGIRKKTAHSA